MYNKYRKQGGYIIMGKLQKAKDGIKEVKETKNMTLYERSRSHPSDEYYTTREIVEFLEERMHTILQEYDIIICPFDSAESEFVKVLTEKGYNVYYSSDDYKNHIEEIKQISLTNNACVFSNPPFSIWRQIIKVFKECEIDFYLLNNLVNACKAFSNNIFGSEIGSIIFKNDKSVPCFLMSNNDIRKINLKYYKPKKNRQNA